MPNDVELLQAWRAGDRDAGSELFERHFPAMRRFFRSKLGDGIEDLIQKTFLACVESHERLRKPESFRIYLFKVARHELYHHLSQRRRNRVDADIGTSSIAELGPSPTAILADKKEHEVLLQALRQIQLDFQIVLELHYWEELSSTQLAEVLEIPVGTVKSRLRRGKEALVAALERLAASPELIESTIQNLEGWARSLRDCVGLERS